MGGGTHPNGRRPRARAPGRPRGVPAAHECERCRRRREPHPVRRCYPSPSPLSEKLQLDFAPDSQADSISSSPGGGMGWVGGRGGHGAGAGVPLRL